MNKKNIVLFAVLVVLALGGGYLGGKIPQEFGSAGVTFDASSPVPVPVSKGGTGATSFTSGSIVFSNGTILTQDNANFFVDDSNNRLGIGSSSPSTLLSVGTHDASTTISAGQFQVQTQDSAGVLWCVVLGPDGAFASVAGACQ